MQLIKIDTKDQYNKMVKLAGGAGGDLGLALSLQTAAIANPEWVGRPALLAKNQVVKTIEKPEEKVRILPIVDGREVIGAYRSVTVSGKFFYNGQSYVREEIENALRAMGANLQSNIPTTPRKALLVLGEGKETNKIRKAQQNPNNVDIMTQNEFWNHLNNFLEVIKSQIIEPANLMDLRSHTHRECVQLYVPISNLGAYENIANGLTDLLQCGYIVLYSAVRMTNYCRNLYSIDNHIEEEGYKEVRILSNPPTFDNIVSKLAMSEHIVDRSVKLVMAETVNRIANER